MAAEDSGWAPWADGSPEIIRVTPADEADIAPSEVSEEKIISRSFDKVRVRRDLADRPTEKRTDPRYASRFRRLLTPEELQARVERSREDAETEAQTELEMKRSFAQQCVEAAVANIRPNPNYADVIARAAIREGVEFALGLKELPIEQGEQ